VKSETHSTFGRGAWNRRLTWSNGHGVALLLLRAAERKLGVCRRLAEAMPDRRGPDRVCHAMFETVMARASAITCGHEDAIGIN
jgi:hypothetical protein